MPKKTKMFDWPAGHCYIPPMPKHKSISGQLADIMVDHLYAMTPEERSAKLKAGKKVLSRIMKKAKSTSASSRAAATASSTPRTSRSPLAARGR